MPLIVWIHGGGWEGGSKRGGPMEGFVASGFAAASVEYRFSQVAKFPAQIQDCQAAIRFLRANAAKYNIDPDHIGVAGESAGGHLAALLGTAGGKNVFPPIGGNEKQSDRVQAVCDFYGPADFTTVVQLATADMLFLDSLYREAASKAGITYVDVWDGFVDEAGRFLQQGPDFEGQNRRLRSYDGVYFTRAGARKLAHYAEREITRLLAGRSAPIALPTEPATPDANALPGQPAPRPLAGPILPLVASSVGTDQLLGGPGSRPAAVDALAARTLVKGEPLAPPAGRADDFAWPRREVGREQAKGETPVANAAPDGTVAAPAAPPKPKKQFRPVQSSTPPAGNFFSFGAPPRQLAPPPAPPRAPAGPRPPANVGRSASVPGFFTR